MNCCEGRATDTSGREAEKERERRVCAYVAFACRAGGQQLGFKNTDRWGFARQTCRRKYLCSGVRLCLRTQTVSMLVVPLCLLCVCVCVCERASKN